MVIIKICYLMWTAFYKREKTNLNVIFIIIDEGNPELTQAQSIVIPIPSQLSELSIQRVHHFVMLKLNGVGVTVKWDTKVNTFKYTYI
jgi:hypothetical protein